jgi:regulator of sigma E protease
MSLAISILVLSFLIFFHELGHFVMARFFGVRVETFSIGFGKKIFAKKFGDTEYALSAIPLGGYVKMKGQNDLDPTENSQDDDSYNTKHPLKRIAILFAGPFANFLLAYILYIIIALNGHQTLSPVIGGILKNSPANIAKLQIGDKIIAINEQEINTWDTMSDMIQNSNGTILLHIKRDNKIIKIKISPKILESKNIFKETEKRVMIGISPNVKESIKKEYSFGESFGFAKDRTIDASLLITKGVQKLIEGVVPTKEVGGIISIVDITSKASDAGIIALLSFMALISINLGILNLFPIPALDGGHIIFNIYELIFRKKISDSAFYYFSVLGWVLIFMLMSLGIYNDITRIVEN